MSLTDIQVGNFYIAGNLIPISGNLSIFGNVTNQLTGTVNFSGNIQCTGDVIGFGNLSDERMKKNIENLKPNECLNVINLLKPVTFDWRDDIFNQSKCGTPDVGMIAQDVSNVAPLVTCKIEHEGEEYMGVNYEKLVPYLIGAIQELSSSLRLVPR